MRKSRVSSMLMDHKSKVHATLIPAGARGGGEPACAVCVGVLLRAQFHACSETIGNKLASGKSDMSARVKRLQPTQRE